MNFRDVLLKCCQTPELVREFNRLSGCALSFVDTRPPIVKMIDDATSNPNIWGNKRDDMQRFISFVYSYIWASFVQELEGVAE